MRTTLSSVACVVCFLAVTYTVAQRDCTVSNFAVQPNFNLPKFLGKWYELKWLPEIWITPEENFRDFLFNYTQFNDTAIDVDWLGRAATKSPYCTQGSARLHLTAEKGKFTYERVYNSSGVTLKSTFWVIKTDYENYALTYGCREVASSGACAAPDAWTWSRTQRLAAQYEAIVDTAISNLCLQTDQLITTQQTRECMPKPVSAAGTTFVSLSLLLVYPLVIATLIM